jgi:signal recognition particle receptor subunit beta
MVSINYATREVSCKIVYYGPGLSGKTTNLQYVHLKVPSNTKGKLISLATDADRTLYFDFLPINIGTINGFASKFQLYTVPGQVYYNATRKLVLRGVDGLVFVADSQPDKMDENIESLNNLKENLAEYGYKIDEIPIVIQYNKQDLEDVLTPDEMRPTLNTRNWPEFKASATEGFGVFDTLKCILKLVLDKAKAAGEAPSKKKAAAGAETPASGTAPIATQPPPAQVAPPSAPPPEAPPQPMPPPAGQPVASPEPAVAPPSPPPPGYDAAAATAPPQPQSAANSSEAVAVAAPAEQKGEIQREEVPATNESQAAPQPVYRPFPGNTAQDEQQMLSQQQPAATGAEVRTENYSGAADAAPHPDKVIDAQDSTSTGTPRMAPSLKADRPRKKKRSFFKRLFGLK